MHQNPSEKQDSFIHYISRAISGWKESSGFVEQGKNLGCTVIFKSTALQEKSETYLGYYEISVTEIFRENKSLHLKMKFSLKISSVDVTKSAVSCGFGHIY